MKPPSTKRNAIMKKCFFEAAVDVITASIELKNTKRTVMQVDDERSCMMRLKEPYN